MPYVVRLKPSAAKQLQKLPEDIKLNIQSALEGLKENPLQGKPLQGPLHGFYSLRVWPYRIIYEIVHKTITVTVVAIGQRKDVYDRLV